jgi:hypothetical protein
MARSKLKYKLPGYAATGLVALITTLWTFWGVGEMYYEGWWGAWYNRLPYLGVPVICLAFTLIALTWPGLGGWIIFLAGGAFTAWRWTRQAQLGTLTVEWVLGWFPISGLLVFVGLLFLLDGHHRRRRRAQGWTPPKRWLRRNLRYVVGLMPPLLTAILVTAYFVPFLQARSDDGDRGAQRIAGNGVTLVWAPKGPGWNWHPLAGRGRRPSWDDIALYGVPPVGIHEESKAMHGGVHATATDMERTGLCRYLSEDGRTLMPEPQDVWRMPTADEVVRSLVQQGEHAGCRWDGVSASAECRSQPNKDTPLWAADESPIYYWTADEYDGDSVWCVPYTGGRGYGGSIHPQPKHWGNSRHGFRCVRESWVPRTMSRRLPIMK